MSKGLWVIVSHYNRRNFHLLDTAIRAVHALQFKEQGGGARAQSPTADKRRILGLRPSFGEPVVS